MQPINMDSKHSIINGLNYTCEKYSENDHKIISQGARFLKIDLAQLSSQKRFDFRNS